LRTKNSARHTFEGKAESSRDVQFSPSNPFEFTSVFENGTVQRWDLRNPSTHEKRFSAHNGLVLALDYHPSGRYITTGGRDKLIKVRESTRNCLLIYVAKTCILGLIEEY
jgi:WD40 repeat protein